MTDLNGKTKTGLQALAKDGQKAKNANGSTATTKQNGHDSAAHATKKTTSSGILGLSMSILVAFVSFGVGVFTPSLVSLYLNRFAHPSATYSLLSVLPPSLTITRQLKAHMHGKGGCISENLSNFLHDKAVPGLHIVCVKEGPQLELELTLYPGSQVGRSRFITTPKSWDHFRDTIVKELDLPFYNDFTEETTEKWAVFTPNGERIADHDTNNGYRGVKVTYLRRILQEGMVLIYQGGTWIWPGVRVGFERHLQVSSVIPSVDAMSRTNQAETNNIITSLLSKAKHDFVTLKTLALVPLVVSVENFLTSSECDYIQEKATPHIRYSDVSRKDDDKGKAASNWRTSQSTFLSSKKDDTMQAIDHRVASLTRIPREHQELLQVLRYGFNGV